MTKVYILYERPIKRHPWKPASAGITRKQALEGTYGATSATELTFSRRNKSGLAKLISVRPYTYIETECRPKRM
jgi:hypothetical protein